MAKNGKKTLAELDRLIAAIREQRRTLDLVRIKAQERSSVRIRLTKEVEEMTSSADVSVAQNNTGTTTD